MVIPLGAGSAELCCASLESTDLCTGFSIKPTAPCLVHLPRSDSTARHPHLVAIPLCTVYQIL